MSYGSKSDKLWHRFDSGIFPLRKIVKEGDKMEFGFVVKWYSFAKKKEYVLGGFLDIKAAKEYADDRTIDLFNGYASVNSKEGKYVLGADKEKSFTEKWYEPGEEAYVYFDKEDKVITLEEAISK